MGWRYLESPFLESQSPKSEQVSVELATVRLLRAQKKHRQKPKVLSVTPNLWRATCFPKQRCLSLVLFDHRRQSTHVLNKETLVTPVSYGFNKNVPASCSKIPHLGQSSNLLVKSILSSAFSWLDIYHGIIRSSTSSEQLPADPSVGCARWPTASSPYPPPLPLMPKQKRGLGHTTWPLSDIEWRKWW